MSTDAWGVVRDDLEVDKRLLSQTEKRFVSEDERDRLEDKGHAMRGGRFPIKTPGDLANAKRAIGRAKGSKAAVRAHINDEAERLGQPKIGKALRAAPLAPTSKPAKPAFTTNPAIAKPAAPKKPALSAGVAKRDWTLARDRAWDRKHGIKEGSKRDNELDRKRGVPVRKAFTRPVSSPLPAYEAERTVAGAPDFAFRDPGIADFPNSEVSSAIYRAVGAGYR